MAQIGFISLGCAKNQVDCERMMYRVQEHGGEATFMGIYTTLDGSQHNSSFNFGEKVLVNGVKMFCSVTYDILGKEV